MMRGHYPAQHVLGLGAPWRLGRVTRRPGDRQPPNSHTRRRGSDATRQGRSAERDPHPRPRGKDRGASRVRGMTGSIRSEHVARTQHPSHASRSDAVDAACRHLMEPSLSMRQDRTFALRMSCNGSRRAAGSRTTSTGRIHRTWRSGSAWPIPDVRPASSCTRGGAATESSLACRSLLGTPSRGSFLMHPPQRPRPNHRTGVDADMDPNSSVRCHPALSRSVR